MFIVQVELLLPSSLSKIIGFYRYDAVPPTGHSKISATFKVPFFYLLLDLFPSYPVSRSSYSLFFAKVDLSVAIYSIRGHYFVKISHSGALGLSYNYLDFKKLIVGNLYLITFRKSESPPQPTERQRHHIFYLEMNHTQKYS